MTTIMGWDPALGGGNALVVADVNAERITILDCRTDYGVNSFEAMFEHIAAFARQYHPNLLIVELDGMQKGIRNDQRLDEMAAVCGFTVQSHTTRNNKVDAVFGVAAMDQTFRRGEIRIPWGDEHTKAKMEDLVHQLRAWRPDVPTRKLRQDLVMALWFIHRHWAQTRAAHVPTPTRSQRPSWVMRDPRKARV